MKTLAFLLFFSCSLCLQSQQWLWAKSIPVKGLGIYMKVKPCATGGFYLTGLFDDSLNIDGIKLYNSGGRSAFLGKFSNDGQCIWLKNSIYPYNTCTSNTGNIYLSGSFKDSLILGNDTFRVNGVAQIIAKYSSAGNLLRAELLEGAYRCIKAINSKNQIIVATGYRDSLTYQGNTYKDSLPLFLKLDSDLNLIQAIQTKAFSLAVQLEAAAGDTLYAVVNLWKPCMYCTETRIQKYSPDLELLADIQYAGASRYNSDPVIKHHDDGHIYLTRHHSYQYCTAAKLSPQLKILWAKSMDWDGRIFSGNGKLFVTGRTGGMNCTESMGNSTVLFEADTSLNCRWSESFTVNNYLYGPGPYFADAFAGEDNSIFLSGYIDKETTFGNYTIGNENPGSFIAKFSYTGIEVDVADNNAESSDISVYPNPSQGIYMVKYNGNNSDTRISVNDIFGNCIFDKTCQKTSETLVDLSAQPKGIYFIAIGNNSQKAIRKVVIE